jgi:hypothetical protein
LMLWWVHPQKQIFSLHRHIHCRKSSLAFKSI